MTTIENKIDVDFYIESTHGKNNLSRFSYDHFHSEYEIYYLDSGSMTYFIEDKVFEVKKGEFVIIRPGTIHITRYKTPEYRRILIYFSEDFIKEFLIIEPNLTDIFNNVHLKLSKQNEKRAEDIMKRILCEYESKSKSIVLIKCLLGELLKLFEEKASPAKTPTLPEYHNKIMSVISYINSNFQNDITLSSLSQKFFLNPAYLSRIFKEVTGMGFKEYLINVRLKESKTLLKDTKLSILEICEKTGFNSQNHFCKTFKAVFGISPMTYRKYK